MSQMSDKTRRENYRKIPIGSNFRVVQSCASCGFSSRRKIGCHNECSQHKFFIEKSQFRVCDEWKVKSCQTAT